MYHGDIRLGDTIDIKFTTRAFATGAPTTLAGSPSVAAYPGNSTTEITAGITLSVDFDSRTGLNNVRIVASGGNGYVTATNYTLVITAGTVSGTSVVGECVGSFSIEARSALMPATAGRTAVVDAAGLIDANVVKVGPTGAGTAQTARDIGASVLLSSGTGTGQIVLNSGVADARLADAVSHGGTLGSSTATLALSRLNVTSQTSNTTAVTVTGNGTGSGLVASSGSGATGDGIQATAASTNGNGFKATGSGTGYGLGGVGGSTGYGISAAASGAVGMNVSSSGLGSNALNLSPGAGGSGLNGSINGSITGNLSGSVGSVTGAVGSVTGNVGGNVVGSVASVTAGVTVTTNNDKTGYSLTQSFPSNFSSMAISAGGVINADIKKVNGVTVNGDGAGTPWGP
jgi:hypothetical protein